MSCKTDSSYEKKRKIQVQRRQRQLRPLPPFRPVLLVANHEHVSDLNSKPDLKIMNKRSGSSFDEMRWKRARIKMTHHHKHPCPPFNFCCSLFNAYVFVVIMFRQYLVTLFHVLSNRVASQQSENKICSISTFALLPLFFGRPSERSFQFTSRLSSKTENSGLFLVILKPEQALTLGLF